MKLLTIVGSIFFMLTNGTSTTELVIPDGLELGRTIRSDLDPAFTCGDNCMYFSGIDFEAVFNQNGFLDKVVFDRSMNHQIPEEWQLSWLSTVEDILDRYQSYNPNLEDRNIVGSSSMHRLQHISFASGQNLYHFYVIEWKDNHSKTRINGLNRIAITSIEE